MIEKILYFSIQRPLVVLLLVLAAAGYGIYAFTQLPIDAVPDITNNQIQINTLSPGLSPLQMEKQVTFPIENALAGIPGLETTRSLSRNGFSQVTAIFQDSVNIYFARQQINERLSAIKESLPPGAEPSMGPITTGLGEIYMWAVDFKAPSRALKEGVPGKQPDGSYLTPEGERLRTPIEQASYLRTVQDWIIKPQLKGLPGLAGIDAIGGYNRQYHIEPRMETMIALGLDFDALIQSLEKNNLSIGPGYIEKNGEAYLVKADERIDSPRDIENVVVATRDGIPIRIQDVADVKIGTEARYGSATENGHEVVIGTALMLIGANSRTVSSEVDLKLKGINETLPADIEVRQLLNRTKLVDATIHTVRNNLTEGAILVISVLFALLGNFRAALLTACVIPLSMLFTAIGMVQSKISGNLMSLGAIDFGLIVDGAVIITENCLRRLSLKSHQLGRNLSLDERNHEVMEASKEMIRPSLFGQAIIITVYIPLLSLSGVEGKMFHPMAMTVVFALLAAFILSVTFVPAMVALCTSGKITEKENKILKPIKKMYAPLLLWACKQRGWVAAGAGVLIILAVMLFTRMGQEFIPALDEQDIAMHAVRIPSTSLTQSTEMQLEVEREVKAIPEVDYVFSKTGTNEVASDPMPPNVSDTFIMLKPRSEWPDPYLSKQALIEKIEKVVRAIPGNNYEFTQPIEMRFNELIAGVRSDLAVKIYGDHFVELEGTAEKIAQALNKIPGAADVKVGQTSGLPVMEVKIDREAAGRLGLNVSDILSVLGIAVGGGKAGELYEGDKRFDLVVKLPEHQKHDPSILGQLPIPLPIPDTKEQHYPFIPLGEIATLTLTEGINEISRENGKRYVAVQANIRGSDLGTFVESAKKKIGSSVKIPEGYWLEWGGQFQNLISARDRLFIVLPVCFALIFMFLYMALGSTKEAILVFSGVPFAFTGGVIALWLRDIPFSISAAVGFIALSGIAVLNGLVLMSAVNQLRKEGKNVLDSITEGSLLRLRPVLMTALVASLGFLPMALASGTGAEVQRPLATVVIGGLLSSTLLTLVVLPALYCLCEFWKEEEEKLCPSSSVL